jgi:hypothetical protein
LLAFGSVTVIFVLYTPTASPDISAATLIDAGVVPLTDDKDNHATFSVAVQFTTPSPLLLIVSTWDGGLVPPVIAEKLILCGVIPIIGGALTCRISTNSTSATGKEVED